MIARFGLILLAAGALAACSTLPRSGPDDGVIEKKAASASKVKSSALAMNYALVDVAGDILPLLTDPGAGSLLKSFGGGRGPAPEIVVGVGDVVQVSIFESSTGGLFIPADAGSRPGNFVTLPNQTVDRRGTISVPYAGLVPANGRSLPQIQQDIEARLASRAIEPQAVVALVEQRASEISVVGEVNAPNKFRINTAGDRVLDIIARAGGLRYPGYESFVTLQRRGKEGTVFFETLVSNAAENIYVAPGDSIYVYREQRSFIAFGASGLNGKFDFETESLTLAEGVARAGGLLDARADPRQVFMYRLEDRSVLEKAGLDLAKFPPQQTVIPTVYRANFRDPASFFVAQSFPMRDKDVLYVSNADQVELFKFLSLVNGVSQTASGVVVDAADAKVGIDILKNKN